VRENTRSAWILILGAFASTVPAVLVRFGFFEASPLVGVLIFGFAICGSAFLISWAAEAAQKHISHGLIIAIVALIVVLPEYAIDMMFSWKAGNDFATYGSYPIANMTGANRLLIGLGWPMVFFIYWLRTRSRVLSFGIQQAVEISAIGAATIYAFFIVLRGTLVFYDAFVLGGIFLAYLFFLTHTKKEEGEAELFGPAKLLASFSAPLNYAILVLIFLAAAGVIFLSADPFGENLIHVGESFGIDKFVLVQWVAPLASELPEFVVAALLVMRISASMGIATLISSKVNQWTLLILSIPLVYAVSAGSLAPFPFDARQTEELFLTASQSLFAVILLARRTFTFRGAALLAVLFLGQLAFPRTEIRYVFSFIYLGLGAGLIIIDRQRILVLFRDALKGFRGEKNGVPS